MGAEHGLVAALVPKGGTFDFVTCTRSATETFIRYVGNNGKTPFFLIKVNLIIFGLLNPFVIGTGGYVCEILF